MTSPRRNEGFPGQRIVVLPRKVVSQALQQPLLRGLIPTDIGHFQKAFGHWRERKIGIDQAIFIYCSSGAGWCQMKGRRHEVRRGELLVVPPFTPHAYGADTKHAWTIHWFHAVGNDLRRFLGELDVTADAPVVFLGDAPHLLALFEEVLEPLERGYVPLHLFYTTQALRHLAAAFVRQRRETWRGDPDPGQRIIQSIEYMKQHLSKPLSVPTLSSLANLSRSHFTALFKEHTGYAPIDYFIRLRMHLACQWLDTTALSIKEIAARLGYEDPFYFSRIFRQVNERSPTEYRAMHKG